MTALYSPECPAGRLAILDRIAEVDQLPNSKTLFATRGGAGRDDGQDHYTFMYDGTYARGTWIEQLPQSRFGQ